MIQVSTFHFEYKAFLKGQGLTFFGYEIENGKCNRGDFIEFEFNNEIIKRKIKNVSFVRNPSYYEKGILSIALIIQCKNKEEAKKIDKAEFKENVDYMIYEG